MRIRQSDESDILQERGNLNPPRLVGFRAAQIRESSRESGRHLLHGDALGRPFEKTEQ